MSSAPQIEGRSRERDGWIKHSCGSVTVAASGQTAVLAGRDVLILGRLFQGTSPVRSLSPTSAAAIIQTDGRNLVERFWGSYLALWRDRRDGVVRILRDPSGAVPLFRAGCGTSALLFTDLGDVWSGIRQLTSIDWLGVSHRLLYPQLPVGRTALAGVSALPPGQSRRADGEDAPRLLWSPWQFAERAADAASPRDNAMAVRAAVDGATAALVARAPVLLELSGGLDSSILAAALDVGGASWSAVTIATPGADGDERRFAAAVADRFGVDLAALTLTAADIDLLAPPRTPTTAPAGFGMLAGVDAAIARLAKERGVAGLVSGIGGDNVFCSLRSPAPVLDAWQDRGLAQAVRTAGDLGRLTGTDHWAVLRSTLRYAARDRRQPYRWDRDARFLDPAAVPPLEPHPWLAAPAGRRAGKRAHVVMLLRAYAVAAAHERARGHAMQLPLLAQPVVETCLAIPTWQWIAGGRDRAIARAAFADRLPPLILQRRSKGRLESLLAPAFDRDRFLLRDRLADGRLVGAGLLDRAAMIAAFAAPASAIDDVYIRLLELADAELWLDGLA